MELVIKSKSYGNHTVYFDDDISNTILQFNWNIAKGHNGVFYVRARVPKLMVDKYKCTSIRMHRLIMNVPANIDIDHADHNGLNNKKENLRLCDKQKQTANTRLHCDSFTGYKGVTYVKKKKLYFTRIRVNGKLISGGRTKDIIKAAKKYNEMAIKYFGEFACLNKIPNE